MYRSCDSKHILTLLSILSIYFNQRNHIYFFNFYSNGFGIETILQTSGFIFLKALYKKNWKIDKGLFNFWLQMCYMSHPLGCLLQIKFLFIYVLRDHQNGHFFAYQHS